MSIPSLPKDLKVSTQMDLELQNSCNCLCFPRISRRMSSPQKPEKVTPTSISGRDAVGRKVSFLPSFSSSKPLGRDKVSKVFSEFEQLSSKSNGDSPRLEF